MHYNRAMGRLRAPRGRTHDQPKTRIAMKDRYLSHLRSTLDEIRAAGFYKTERVIASPQSSAIRLANGSGVLNFCANNYLGLADDRRLVEAAKAGLDADGFGMASVRF